MFAENERLGILSRIALPPGLGSLAPISLTVNQVIGSGSWISLERPEPYLVRAKLWAAARNNDAALRDYLEASRAVSGLGINLVTYAKYFQELRLALDELDKAPKPPTYDDAIA